MERIALVLCTRLDQGRRKFFDKFMLFLKPFLTSRDVRICFGGVILMLFSLMLALGAPFWSMALGPVILGIPHVFAGLHYLIKRQGFDKKPLILVIFLLVIAATLLNLNISLVIGLNVLFLFVIETEREKKVLAFIIINILVLLSLKYEYFFHFCYLHLHNFIAVFIWWLWSPKGLNRLIPLLCFLLINFLLIFCSSADFSGFISSHPELMGKDYFLSYFIPFETSLATGILLSFAFSQSVHYAIWLRMIPDEDHKQKTPRTFLKTYKTLKAEWGLFFLAMVSALTLFFLFWSFIDVEAAGRNYLQIFSFHANLEISSLIILFLLVSYKKMADSNA